MGHDSSLLKQLWRKVQPVVEQSVATSPQITDKEEQENSRLLAGLLLSTITVLILIVLLVVYFDPDDLTDRRTLTALAVIFISALLYTLNRRGFSRSTRFAFIMILTLILVAIPYAGKFTEMSAFTVIPMLLAGMFYSFRVSITLNTSIIVTIFLLNSLVVTDETIWDRRILWYFILFAGALILVFKQHLGRLDSIRNQKLADANAHLRATFTAIPDFLFEINSKGELVSYHVPESASVVPLFAKFVGRSIADSLPEDAAKTVLEAVQSAKEKGRHSGATFPLDLNNGTRWFEMSISTKHELDELHQEKSFLILARDITERRQAEILREAHTRLEVELEKEKELTQLRSQLMSMITHEIRTPMAVIQTSTDLLTRYRDRLSTQQRDEKINMIVEQVKRLDDLIENASIITKSQSGFLRYNPQPIDIVAFCKQLVDELQVIVQENNELVFGSEDHFDLVPLDANLLRHALTNLITNGLKYSPHGGVVTVRLNGDTEQIRISVMDEGIGIPEDDMDDLFTPFQRASNVGKIQGTGLGLVIAKEAINLHGGEIHCESVIGQGTTFVIWFSLNAEN